MSISKPIISNSGKLLYTSNNVILKSTPPISHLYWCIWIKDIQNTTNDNIFQMSEFEFLDGSNNTIRPDTLHIISSSTGETGQSAEKLFDNSVDTKFCVRKSSNIYCIFDFDKSISPVSYRMCTANDNSTWKGRNPKTWNIMFSDVLLTTYSDSNWNIWSEHINDFTMKDVNYTWYNFNV